MGRSKEMSGKIIREGEGDDDAHASLLLVSSREVSFCFLGKTAIWLKEASKFNPAYN